ncbi:MAG: bifunctional DNA-formamidopyrimidine glycosylase/DNA-(apurinic or apyrimidinic site) lyase [Cardiobacteriaceae bacterium]|nr:bifunctional DNA-formamidopyrimidine glycosylase/DNA-(apurinic or apyrimidinic site) lyase [Cardiobacteriaceae bacterium]
MPELPEVETVCCAISPQLVGKNIRSVVIRAEKLRRPLDKNLRAIENKNLCEISRRAKYLIFHFDEINLLIHLGMSGVLRICREDDEILRHDHLSIITEDGLDLRLNDPRRFGLAMIYPVNNPPEFLINLGVEPLSEEFNAKYLFEICKTKSAKIKQVLMEQKNVVGVGNIYACEALFQAEISPLRSVKTLTKTECEKLVAAVKDRLQAGIQAGGTTLRDFFHPDGKPGYFSQKLAVYGKVGEKCMRCSGEIENEKISGRSSFFCPKCQK